MCGRFVQRPVLDFGLPSLVDLAPALAEIPPSYNLAPTQRASVILDRGTGRQVSRLAWGLLPFWAKAKTLQGSTINARIETVATKPAFRSAFKKRRCWLPACGRTPAPYCPTATWEPSPSSPATAAASRPTSTTACR